MRRLKRKRKLGSEQILGSRFPGYLLFWSLVLWVALGIFFALAGRPELLPVLQLTATMSTGVKVWLYAKTGLLLVLLNLLAGLLCALPALIAALWSNLSAEAPLKRHGIMAFLRVKLVKYFPLMLLGLASFLFFASGVGSCPQCFSDKDRLSSVLFRFSKEANEAFYYPADTRATVDRWKQTLQKLGPNSRVIFAAPLSLLQNESVVRRIFPSSLEDPGFSSFLVHHPSQVALFQDFVLGQRSSAKWMSFPIAFEDLAKKPGLAEKKDALKSFGLSNEHLYFSGEWQPLRWTENWDNSRYEALPLGDLLTLAVLQTQVHLFFFARNELFGFFNRHAKWQSLVSDDSALIHDMLRRGGQLAKSKQTIGQTVFLGLSENEIVQSHLRTIFPRRWSANTFIDVAKWRIDKFTKLMGTGFSVNQNLGTQGTKIYLLPYVDRDFEEGFGFGILPVEYGRRWQSLMPLQDFSQVPISPSELSILLSPWTEDKNPKVKKWCNIVSLPSLLLEDNAAMLKSKILSIYENALNKEFASSGELPDLYKSFGQEAVRRSLLCHASEGNDGLRAGFVRTVDEQTLRMPMHWLLFKKEDWAVADIADYQKLAKELPEYTASFVSLADGSLQEQKAALPKANKFLKSPETLAKGDSLKKQSFVLKKLVRQKNGVFLMHNATSSEIDIFTAGFAEELSAYLEEKPFHKANEVPINE